VRRCIFCGGEIEASAPPEHVIPQWISRAYPNAMFTTKHRDGRVITSKVLEITVETVCKTCNHHWMSDLETWASPMLKPMLKGGTQGLSVQQQVLIAQWATKTAMTLDQTFPVIEERIFTAAECRQLMDRKLPPLGVGVRLGRYVGGGIFLDFGHNDLYRAVPEDSRRDRPDGYRTAMRIDQLVVEVNVTSDAHLDLRVAQIDVRDLLLLIWPVSAPLAWPPRIAMTDDTWASFIAPDLPDARK
jgi:hypothetical protein